MTPLTEIRRREEETYAKQNPRARALYERAVRSLPGGSTRTLTYFPPFPLYVSRGEGPRLWDVDGNVRVDLFNNATSLIHGHSHPEVVRAIQEVAGFGTAFASATEWEIRLAEILVERLPSVERVRFCNSGTEANVMAVRAMRAFTGRPKIAKFEGGYHGSFDDVSVSVHPSAEAAGDRRFPRAVPDSDGIPPEVIGNVVVLPFNDLEAVAERLRPLAREVSGVLIEPVMGSAGMISPRPGFLQGLRDLTRELGMLLVFDEVMMFRLSKAGAQGFFGVAPDVTTLGKIIGGGLPVGGLGGRADVMALFDPTSGRTRIPHAGTFNANPVTMAAGVATLGLLDEDAFGRMAADGEYLRRNLRELVRSAGIPVQVTGECSLFKLHFTGEEITDSRSAHTSNRELERLMFLYALNRGVFINTLARGCLSTVTQQPEIDRFLEVAEAFFRDLAGPA
ncbi:MAG: aspartate aminotransferase family protein [Candidatus Tectomicrobia bacterium]|nr:aspartate aminotransferase family protein [Candidatus Tectomicrobia bacterium]